MNHAALNQALGELTASEGHRSFTKNEGPLGDRRVRRLDVPLETERRWAVRSGFLKP